LLIIFLIFNNKAEDFSKIDTNKTVESRKLKKSNQNEIENQKEINKPSNKVLVLKRFFTIFFFFLIFLISIYTHFLKDLNQNIQNLPSNYTIH
jgi:hypothetical protein